MKGNNDVSHILKFPLVKIIHIFNLLSPFMVIPVIKMTVAQVCDAEYLADLMKTHYPTW